MKKSMYVFSIYNGHNATAALLRNGKIIACASEERFVGIKNYHGFPKKSIAWCLSYAGIQGQDLEAIVFPYTIEVPIYVEDGKSADLRIAAVTLLYKATKALRSLWGLTVYILPFLRLFGRYVYVAAANTLGRYAMEKQKHVVADYLHVPINKIVAYDHHLSHAASAYYSSRFTRRKALVLTLDGEGDGFCSTVSIFDNKSIVRIASTPREHSLGYVYQFVTRFLGMKAGEHEYKVMGLAPYAKEYDVLKLYERIKDLVILNPRNPLTFLSPFNTQDTLSFLTRNVRYIRFDVIAGAFQRLLEDRVCEWVSTAVHKTGIKTVICSGGVFMNVKANQKIAAIPEVKQVYFMPSSGDESTPIGACYLAYNDFCKSQNRQNARRAKPLGNIYLGPSYSDEYIEHVLRSGHFYKKYKINKVSHIEYEIARRLARGEIIARMAGRMEFGARALGNRSILADPSRLEVVRIINEQIKSRDFWMPFAPTILFERMGDYCINPKKIDAPYMMISFDSTPLARQHLKAAMHPYDLTLRPQVLRGNWNPSYYKLIKEFERLTGIGGVLNTSFNLHGFPIVLGPKEALYVFEHSGIQRLVLEQYVVEKYD